MLYNQEYGDDVYDDEPSDAQANVILRALTHAVAKYYPTEPEMSVQAIALDFLEANAASTTPLSRDECERIAAVFKVEV